MLIALTRGIGEISVIGDFDILDTDDGVIETVNYTDLLDIKDKISIQNLRIDLSCSIRKMSSFVCSNRRWLLKYKGIYCDLVLGDKMITFSSDVAVETFCLRGSHLDILLRKLTAIGWVTVDLDNIGSEVRLLGGRWHIDIEVQNISYENYLRRML